MYRISKNRKTHLPYIMSEYCVKIKALKFLYTILLLNTQKERDIIGIVTFT